VDAITGSSHSETTHNPPQAQHKITFYERLFYRKMTHFLRFSGIIFYMKIQCYHLMESCYRLRFPFAIFAV